VYLAEDTEACYIQHNNHHPHRATHRLRVPVCARPTVCAYRQWYPYTSHHSTILGCAHSILPTAGITAAPAIEIYVVWCGGVVWSGSMYNARHRLTRHPTIHTAAGSRAYRVESSAVRCERSGSAVEAAHTTGHIASSQTRQRTRAQTLV
jgi:hypothetical protein